MKPGNRLCNGLYIAILSSNLPALANISHHPLPCEDVAAKPLIVLIWASAFDYLTLPLQDWVAFPFSSYNLQNCISLIDRIMSLFLLDGNRWLVCWKRSSRLKIKSKVTELGVSMFLISVRWRGVIVSCVKIPHGCSDWSCLSPPASVEASDWATVTSF